MGLRLRTISVLKVVSNPEVHPTLVEETDHDGNVLDAPENGRPEESPTGVTYVAPDEGAFLYWEFEVKDGRHEQEAVAAMHDAFGGQELQDSLTLYREFVAKLPTLPASEKPTLRLERPHEIEGS